VANPKIATVVYTNWRGETQVRHILPDSIWFGTTDYHPEPQWFVLALDTDKGEYRDFALLDFHGRPPTD
jgi:hypothetical protein